MALMIHCSVSVCLYSTRTRIVWVHVRIEFFTWNSYIIECLQVESKHNWPLITCDFRVATLCASTCRRTTRRPARTRSTGTCSRSSTRSTGGPRAAASRALRRAFLRPRDAPGPAASRRAKSRRCRRRSTTSAARRPVRPALLTRHCSRTSLLLCNRLRVY